jgi:hypothetical protein
MPSGNPVSEQVVSALEALMATIVSDGTPGAPYFTDVVKVVRYDSEALNTNSAPMIAIIPSGSDYDDPGGQNVGELVDDMDVRLLLILRESTDPGTKLLRFERDVKKAILADISLGGVALKTSINSSTHTLPEERDSLAFTDLSIRVRFRTPRTDLHTST